MRLDERHRSREPIWLRIHARDLEELRSVLENVPASLWVGGMRLRLTKARRLIVGQIRQTFDL